MSRLQHRDITLASAFSRLARKHGPNQFAGHQLGMNSSSHTAWAGTHTVYSDAQSLVCSCEPLG